MITKDTNEFGYLRWNFTVEYNGKTYTDSITTTRPVDDATKSVWIKCLNHRIIRSILIKETLDEDGNVKENDLLSTIEECRELFKLKNPDTLFPGFTRFTLENL